VIVDIREEVVLGFVVARFIDVLHAAEVNRERNVGHVAASDAEALADCRAKKKNACSVNNNRTHLTLQCGEAMKCTKERRYNSLFPTH
jgi:hypothetical protein